MKSAPRALTCEAGNCPVPRQVARVSGQGVTATVWGYGDSLRDINARVPGRNKINCHRNFRHRNFQSLFDAGIRTLDILDEQFEHFVRWSDAIFECKAKYYNPDLFSPIPEFPKGPEFLDCKITCSTLGTSTITELLERTAMIWSEKH
jgi:hypothetical protein